MYIMYSVNCSLQFNEQIQLGVHHTRNNIGCVKYITYINELISWASKHSNIVS